MGNIIIPMSQMRKLRHRQVLGDFVLNNLVRVNWLVNDGVGIWTRVDDHHESVRELKSLKERQIYFCPALSGAQSCRVNSGQKCVLDLNIFFSHTLSLFLSFLSSLPIPSLFL